MQAGAEWNDPVEVLVVETIPNTLAGLTTLRSEHLGVLAHQISHGHLLTYGAGQSGDKQNKTVYDPTQFSSGCQPR